MRALVLVPVLFGLQSLAQGLMSRNFPHLIIPIKKSEPNTAFGTAKEFDIERDIWTETSFDVPANGATFCGFQFIINTDKSRGAPWKLWDGDSFRFNISSLPPEINKDTDTWNKHPSPIEWVSTIEVYNDGAVRMVGGQWFACAHGQVAQYLLHPADLFKTGGLTWYELDDPLHGLTYNMYF